MADDHEGGEQTSSPMSRRERRRLRSRRHNPDGTMTLIEHLYEFRRRLAIALGVIAVGTVFGYIWFDVKLGPIESLGELIRQPYCSLPKGMIANFAGTGHGDCRLLQTRPFESFGIRLQVGVAAGMILTAPLWLYQFWAFIAPGLYAKERRYGRIFVLTASVLFVLGAAMAYGILPGAMRMLVGVGAGNFTTALTGGDYISFLITLLVIFGVSFELPLLIIMLNRVGVLPYSKLSKWRRGLIMALFVFAAVITPADPFSMLALSFALVILFELAIQIARLHDKKADRKRADLGWDKLADDEAAPFEYTPSTSDGSTSSEDIT